MPMWTVAQLARDLAAGKTTSRSLVEQALARIADPAGEGARAFLKVYAETARAEADFSDRLRRSGAVRSPVEGLPVSVKDLFDLAGDVTRAGSKILAGAPPAKADAPAVARLRAAGAVIVGRTNMVEFAFGAAGLNPHYGTPKNPWDRKTGRVPGGSTSGGAVAQADGMCAMALGSDTRGSIRQPAALCGVAGFKPTAARVPREGAFPLSYTMDSIGPLASTIECCAAYDAVLAGEPADALPEWPARGLRLLVPKSSVLEDLDREVAAAFENALARLARAGVLVVERPVPAFDRQGEYFRNGGISGVEAYHVHRPRLDRLGEYDPRVAKRITMGEQLSGADYVELVRLRASFIREVEALAAPFDAIVMPTAPCVAPTIEEVDASDEAYFRWNLRILRNTGLANFLDGCAATLPCHEPGSAPVGFMVCGPAGSDRRLLAVAAAIERALTRD
ncbi:MAG: amidase [Betaproteobacteria bacterium RIFCSPLOWO2_12_FULL_68_20]|nr:MAG: amidase [Betaproteobacteria bacterium RIFCSPLOWO2_12_FULL_68_20]